MCLFSKKKKEKSTNLLTGSCLFKSKRSGITEKATRYALPSSNNSPRCPGPITICLTGVLSCAKTDDVCGPYLLILSETSLNLKFLKQKIKILFTSSNLYWVFLS